jgi:GTP:adenosylcobinamide-phosphate guanylyltransferase
LVAVITAGGPIDGEYARRAGTDRKAMAPVRGRTMIARTIDALRECDIERIAVVGNDAVRDACSDRHVRIIADAGSGSANVTGALDAWPDDGEALLFLTCDLPYINATSVRWFLERVNPQSLSMPLCDYGDFAVRFPGCGGFGITLAGERVVNTGVFHVPPGTRERLRTLAAAMFEARKAPWKMARIVGPAALVRFALGRLSIADIEARAARAVGCPVTAPRNAPPELAFDADTVEEYAYALEHE